MAEEEIRVRAMDFEMEDRLRKLGEEMIKTDYKKHWIEYTKGWFDELQKNDINGDIDGIDVLTRKLKDRVGDKEAYSDILREGRFAYILTRSRFSKVTFIKEERDRRLPDIKAEYGRQTIYFEVTRKHPGEDDKQFSHPGAGPYWVKTADSGDIIGKIQGKLPQLKPGEINIVVIWSDTVTWSENNLREAHEYIKQEIYADPQKRYRDLSAILFTPGGYVNVATLKQFYLFKNDNASKPLGIRLTNKLDNLHEKDIRQLQRGKKEREVAFMRLKNKMG